MQSNYEKIVKQNLGILFSDDLPSRADAMAARLDDGNLCFSAFGEPCRISSDSIWLGDTCQTGPKGIILSLYALHAIPEDCKLEPFKAFKELPNSTPYAGAFSSHTEQPLTSLVDRILDHLQPLIQRFDGQTAPQNISGDGAIIVHPLPKIALCYIFYTADEDFPASAICLLSNNATAFLPMDALADTGEYTSRAIINYLQKID